MTRACSGDEIDQTLRYQYSYDKRKAPFLLQRLSKCTYNYSLTGACFYSAHQKRKDFMADINRIRQTHGLSKVAEPTDCGSELKDMIVKTKILTQGPWYKCNKGTL